MSTQVFASKILRIEQKKLNCFKKFVKFLRGVEIRFQKYSKNSRTKLKPIVI